ncbi:MAG TPA: TetR/AcrR family transcriptional regulator [Bacteroidota bacterium]|nr:TetR/AcrR family transcriptional regulator [Bacteroidota bacterium]
MSDLEIKKRIMETASEWFYRHGFSRVTMDELAEKMGMSKKTLYKYFSSKDDLLNELVEVAMNQTISRCVAISEDRSVDLVTRLKQTMTIVALEYSKIGKLLLEDIQRNAPHIWKKIDSARREHILTNFARMLREGCDLGIFRKDIDQQLMLLIYTNTIQNIINPDILVQVPFSAAQVFEGVIKIFYEGIMTPEGRAKYLNNKPTETVEAATI